MLSSLDFKIVQGIHISHMVYVIIMSYIWSGKYQRKMESGMIGGAQSTFLLPKSKRIILFILLSSSLMLLKAQFYSRFSVI